jgi:hypothetical protein
MVDPVTPNGSEKDNSNDKEGLFYILFFLLIIFVITLPSAIVATLFRFFVSNRLKRIESWAITCLAIFWIAVTPGPRFIEYSNWVRDFLTNGRLSNFPYISALALGVIYASLWGAISSSFVSTRLPFTIPTSPWKKPLEPGSLGVLPSESERQYSGSVVATGKALNGDETGLPINNTTEIGKRSFTLGVDKHGQPVSITEQEMQYHGLLFGSTGSGKTETIKTIMGALLDLGWFGCVLDLKEDTGPGGLSDWCREYSDYHALPYQELALSSTNNKVWFNPLYGMGPDEARDTIIGSQQFDDGYYRSLNEKQLGQLIRLTYAANSVDPTRYTAPTVYDLGKILSAPNLAAATKEMVATVVSSTPGIRKEEFDSLLRPDEAMAKAAGGLGARLTALYETEAARRSLRPSDSKPDLDITSPGLTYIGLSSSGMPEISRLVSAAVIRRMSVFAADRITGRYPNKHPRFLIIDEANFVNRTLLLELLARARSAWIPVIVCTQGPTDWTTRSIGEAGLESLVQNVNITVIMNQGERTNAELCADIIGKEETMRYSHTLRDGELLDGSGSGRSSTEHLVSPDDLRRLGIGEAVVRIGKPSERVTWAKIPQRDPKVSVKRK